MKASAPLCPASFVKRKRACCWLAKQTTPFPTGPLYIARCRQKAHGGDKEKQMLIRVETAEESSMLKDTHVCVYVSKCTHTYKFI